MQACILLVLVASLTASPATGDDGLASWIYPVARVLLCEALTVIAAWGIASRTVADVQCQHRSQAQILRRLRIGKQVHLTLWVVVQLLVLTAFRWPLQLTETLGGSILLDELFGLLPILGSLIASWAVQFDADRCTNTDLLTISRRAYVLAKVRNGLFLPAVPILILLGHADLLRLVAPQLGSGPMATALHAAPLLLVVICFPLFLRYLWLTEPLGDARLRCRLQQRANHVTLPLRDILVWNTNLQAANAAMCGVLASFRYVFLTDRLIRDLTPREVEMVFLHELAHAKFRHSGKLIVALVVILGSGVMLTKQLAVGGETIPIILAVGITFLFLGRYARLFELQADLWAVSQNDIGPREYLQALARVGGNGRPDRATWLHPSFAMRCRLVLADRPQALRWIQWRLRMTTISWIALGTSIAALAAYGST